MGRPAADRGADPGSGPPRPPRPPRRQRVADFLTREIWRRDWAEAPTLAALGVHLLRLVTIAGRGVVEHKLGMRAAALTYYTVLSLVPTLAFGFALAKGFGAYDRLENQVIRPFVDSTFGGGARPAGGAGTGGETGGLGDIDGSGGLEAVDAGAGPDGAALDAPVAADQGASGLRDAIDQVLEFVTATDVSSLGGIGLAVLLYTLVKLLGHIEAALNATFGIRRLRSIPRRIADYTAMAVITPILALAATALGAATESQGVMDFLRNRLELGLVLDLLLRLIPLVAFTFVFALLYLVMVNTRVRLRSALVGGFVAAVLWIAAQRIYVDAQVGVASYNSLYAGFAAIPLFLVWLWMSWMVVLAGAEFAHADQNHRAYGDLRLAGDQSEAEIERTGLRVLVRMVGRFRHGESPWTVEELVGTLGVPQEQVRSALERLERARLVLPTELEHDEGWLLAVDPAAVPIERARRALRGELPPLEAPGPVDRALEAELAELDREIDGLASNRSLDDLAGRIEERAS